MSAQSARQDRREGRDEVARALVARTEIPGEEMLKPLDREQQGA